MRAPGESLRGDVVAGIDPERAQRLRAELVDAGSTLDCRGRQVGSALALAGAVAPGATGALLAAGEWSTSQAAALVRRIDAVLAEARAVASAGLLFLLTGGGRPSVEEVRAFMATLDGDQRDWLVHAGPGLIGPLDGVPPAMRIAANRILIEQDLARLQSGREDVLDELERDRVRRLVRAGASLTVPWPFRLPVLDWIGDEEQQHRRQLAQIERDIERRQRFLEPGRQFLLFDRTGDGRAAELFGDLDDAEHVAIVVPGVSNSLANFEGFRGNAQRLRDATGGRAAVIAWLGYDAPDGPLPWQGATGSGAARQAGRDLARFLDGIVADPAVHTTVIGHSYGSLATGLGLLGSLEPDDAVFVGSPGVGVDNRSQLPGDVRIWAAKAQWDLVPLAPVHGQDPASDEFGALRFRTGDITGHSSYFQTGSESLRNIAHIVVGEPPTRVE